MDSIWAQIKNNHGDRIMHKLIHYIPERIEHRERWVGGIQKTTVPLKLIDGRVNPISGAHMVAHYRELIPNANVAELAEVGHYPQVQAPKEVLEAYLKFRDQVARSGSGSPVPTTDSHTAFKSGGVVMSRKITEVALSTVYTIRSGVASFASRIGHVFVALLSIST
jgi:hypothetical protein